MGEQADGHEGDALVPIIERARFACPALESVGADQGFAAERVWRGVADAGVTAFVPPSARCCPPTMASPDRCAARGPSRPRALQDPGRGVGPRAGWPTLRARSLNSNPSTASTARCRGTPLFHVQLLLGCTALNLKRLASHVGETASGAAAGPQTPRITALEAREDASGASEGVHHRSSRPPAARDSPTRP